MALSLKLSVPQRLMCNALVAVQSEAGIDAISHWWQQLGEDKAFALAQVNHVTPILAHALKDALGFNNVPTHWGKVHQEIYCRISAYLAELDRVAALLFDEGIALVALKNCGIARGIYPCPGCCPMGDLDVLVEKRYFLQAHQILVDDGYRFEFRNPFQKGEFEEAEKKGATEYWKFLSNGERLWLELQWRSVAGRWILPYQEPTAEDLMARSVPIPGTTVRLLAPEDNLLQVALHTAKHSYVRAPGFRLHLDVDRIVKGQEIDWDLFIQRVLQLGVKTPVFFSLVIPKILFDTPIPDNVLERLKVPQWKAKTIARWLGSAGLFNPDERKFGRISYILFNALLYDDFQGLMRSILPDWPWMSKRYGIESKKHLPILYLKRLKDLTFRRLKI